MKNATKAPRAPKAPKATPAPVETAPAPETAPKARKIRPSKFAGKFLRVLGEVPVVPNLNNGADARRQKASRRTASRNLLRAAGETGLKFEDYLAKGGHPGDLARDARKGAVEISAEPFAGAAPAKASGKGKGRKTA